MRRFRYLLFSGLAVIALLAVLNQSILAVSLLSQGHVDSGIICAIIGVGLGCLSWKARKGAKWAALAVFLLVMYPLSLGPAKWSLNHFSDSSHTNFGTV